MRYHRWILSVVLLVTVVLVSILLAQAEPRREAAGVLGVLRKGQPISLKDRGSRYEITLFEGTNIPMGHEVVEVGSDYLVVKDIANVTVSRIPIYAVKSVNTMRTGGRPGVRGEE